MKETRHIEFNPVPGLPQTGLSQLDAEYIRQETPLVDTDTARNLATGAFLAFERRKPNDPWSRAVPPTIPDVRLEAGEPPHESAMYAARAVIEYVDKLEHLPGHKSIHTLDTMTSSTSNRIAQIDLYKIKQLDIGETALLIALLPNESALTGVRSEAMADRVKRIEPIISALPELDIPIIRIHAPVMDDLTFYRRTDRLPAFANDQLVPSPHPSVN